MKFQLLPEYVPQMERRRVERNNTFIFSLSVRCCCCTYILSVTFRRKQLNLMRKLNSNSLLRFGCAASLASDRKWSTSKLALNYGTSAVEYELAVPVPTLYAFICCIQNEIWTFNTINWNWVLQKNSKCNQLRPKTNRLFETDCCTQHSSFSTKFISQTMLAGKRTDGKKQNKIVARIRSRNQKGKEFDSCWKSQGWPNRRRIWRVATAGQGMGGETLGLLDTSWQTKTHRPTVFA